MSRCLLFPGQGSTEVRMCEELDKRFPEAARVIDEGDKFFRTKFGRTAREFMYGGPPEALASAMIAPMVGFVASMAYFEAVKQRIEWPGTPLCHGGAAVLGHSAGTYSALRAVDAIGGLATGLEMLFNRGLAMSANIRSLAERGIVGGMTALSSREPLPMAVIEGACGDVGDVGISCYNSPVQVVLSGKRESLERVGQYMRENTGKGKPHPAAVLPTSLNVEGPFHSSLMGDAGRDYQRYLRRCRIWTFPDSVSYISDTRAGSLSVPQNITESLAEQMTSPVRFEAAVDFAVRDLGCDRFIEVGHGRVLSKLVQKIASHRGYQEIEVSHANDILGLTD